MNRHTVSTSSNKLTYVPELSDDDSSGKENCSGRGGGRPNLYVKDSSDEEFDKILDKLNTRRTVPKNGQSAKKISQRISNPGSDDSFESLLNRLKTPKSVPRKGSVSRHDGLKKILVNLSSDEDSILETKKPLASQAISKSKLKPLQVSQQCDSPAFLSDDDDAGNEIPITNTIKTTYVHPIPKGSRDTPVLSVMTPIPSSAPLKKSVSRQTVLSSDSDGSFEEFLNRVKTPKAQLRKGSISGSDDSLKKFIVDSSDDDFVFEPKKTPFTKGSTKSKLPEASPQVERRPLSNYDSPVFLSDDDDDNDGAAIKSTWRTRHTKPTSMTPRSCAAPVPSSAPPKSSLTKLSGWISSDEDEVESLMDRLKKNLRLNSDRAQTPKNKPEPKKKPCLSDSAVKGIIQPTSRPVKGAEGNNTPVQTPTFRPVSQTEPRARNGSRLPACKVPGCFLQSLSDPTSAYCRNFKQSKEELTSKLYRLYNTSVFESKLPADMSVTWCNKMRKTAGFCITGQERGTGLRYARIRLSVKVCDSADRLRDTLVHEMCHAAPWLIHNIRDGHGPIWKMFAQKARLAHPELPMVSRCHSYDIKYKFQYQCSRCKNTIGRHSKSLDVQRFVCALCTGPLVLITPSNSRAPTPFAIFVKENFKTVRQQLAGQSHGDVMRKLSADFSSKTRLSES
ncbi:acidic repeat-containing protein [Clupea harengus]|uniref:Acidic repeat-containing protein n=1 Tax=Clupea harengus TaxID=7950 RepID=A0A8M1KG13_CLUHA|nr:acidic repeat-containing protein [Clupea harengus]